MLKSINKKFLVPTTIAFSLLTLCACSDDNSGQQRQAMPVDVYTVIAKDVPISSRLTGRANATRKAEVRPQVSGIIQKRLFVEGSFVNEGDQLYQIDPSLYEANVATAKANLASAQANLNTSKLKAQRYKKLLDSNAVSKQAYDDANATYLQADAGVMAARSNLKTAQINLAYTKVYAPISGIISKSNFTEGALVSAAQASALTTIQQLDPIYVDLGQSVEDHLQLRRAISNGKFKSSGDKPKVQIYFSNGQKYSEEGTLEFSGISVDESSGMVNLRAIVPNKDKAILPGMFIRADLDEGIVPDAVLVDQNAITREANGGAFVYVIENGVAKKRDLKLSTTYENYYIVSNGLKANDIVITSNLQKIRDGVPVVDIKTMQQNASK